MFGRTSVRFLVSNALSLLGNSIAAVALPLILLATTGDALAAKYRRQLYSLLY